MGENIVVKTASSPYRIFFERDFESLKNEFELAELAKRKICILTDSNVDKIYTQNVKDVLSSVGSEIFSFAFEAGEKNKSLETINEFYKFFLENKFDRKTVIVALGGGVTGDMAGFAAATYLRGITFVQVPTTLLAQVDSSVGGKVGVDFGGRKNIIGAFYQPKLVHINIETLKTLPEREFWAGMAEVIKYGLILSEDFYDYIMENKQRIKNGESAVMERLVSECCLFKSKVVAEDEKESGLREILNFGHTIGHAIESVKNFELLHGECVGIGMVAAMYISYKRNAISLEKLSQFKELLEYFNIPVKTNGISADDVYNMMFNDKKVKDNKIGFVLLSKLGKCYSTTDVSEEEILEAINYVICD